ncbi:MAG: 16S rRNA (cytidine(1402)-2'-O)-methyltransferase [Pseudomonadota bacterium]
MFQIGEHNFTSTPLEPGLYIVATPIGNLRDITIRALETLSACDLLACEDTRMTRRLLDRYAIAKRPIAYHEHNAEKAGAEILGALVEGKSVALVSDAGTPLISDPGYRLVVETREAGFPVFTIPGASAVIAALSVSGLPTDDFRFCGFLPNKEKARQDKLATLRAEQTTLVFYEAPGRLTKALQAIAEVMGAERQVVVARELTKRYETIVSGAAKGIAQAFAVDAVKGEIVILIEPAGDQSPSWSDEEIERLLADLAAEMPASKAAKTAAEKTGLAKADLYQRIVSQKAENG